MPGVCWASGSRAEQPGLVVRGSDTNNVIEFTWCYKGACSELWGLVFLGEGKGEKGERLTQKVGVGKAHAKQRVVCTMAQRCGDESVWRTQGAREER